ncbi:hypothetical protein IJG89_01950 [Candidatus Saccharibacteria bacterium]|nr:hypothetical protein [Candidatus Saccharibacteria bacterium]
MLYRGAESRVGEVLKTWLEERRTMDELDLDYVIIKLKKKSSGKQKTSK